MDKNGKKEILQELLKRSGQALSGRTRSAGCKSAVLMFD